MGKTVSSTYKEIANELLDHLSLNQSQATVLVDERSDPPRLTVYILDAGAAYRCPEIAVWKGHPVRLIRDAAISALKIQIRDRGFVRAD